MNHPPRNITGGMVQPVGKVLELRYSSMAADPNGEDFMSTVAITFRTPEGDEQTRQYGDGPYNLEDQHLQLLAALGHQPTDYGEERSMDLSAEGRVIPLVYNPDGNETGWYVSQSVFARGKKALKSADWNDFGDDDSAVTVNVGGSND